MIVAIHPSAEDCGSELVEKALGWMATIIDGIHEANPDAQVVGFGYDTMFGGIGCGTIAKSLFPQCWRNASEPNPVRCFNTQLVRIQTGWETLASTRSFVHPVNLLGATQVAGGDPGAAVGKPNLDKFGPAKYWPLTLECFHPSKVGGDNSGAMVIMKEFYKQYWSTALSC